MSATPALDAEGQQLLALLVSNLGKANPKDPRTFLGYKEVHEILRLPQVRETYGESLKAQGLVSLADWTLATNKLGITGLVIDRTPMMPGNGLFRFVWKAGRRLCLVAGRDLEIKNIRLVALPSPTFPISDRG